MTRTFLGITPSTMHIYAPKASLQRSVLQPLSIWFANAKKKAHLTVVTSHSAS